MADELRRHFRVDLGYHGGKFYGSQRQAGLRTVQSELEEAIEQITGHRVRLTLAGRTDRGVHAVGQVASGSLHWNGTFEGLRYAIDSVTGDDLTVIAVDQVDESFDARFSAHWREYRYRIWNSHTRPVLLSGVASWVRRELDVGRLNDAAAMFVGDHDFRSFTGKGFGTGASERKTTRTVLEAGWREIHTRYEPGGRLIEFVIRADSYLPHMVRNLVGAQIEVGSGRKNATWLKQLLLHRDRGAAPPPGAPEGLVLWHVEYNSDF